jgi:2-(1,2-epoxy-1,2-dihydrophenyl)acetyl-CoA isomerase
MTQQYPDLQTERHGSVLIVRLDNPGARNALSREMRLSLRDVTRAVEEDHSIRAVYLTASGPVFCSGGDLQMLKKANEPWPVHRRFAHAATVFPPLATLAKPVVCGVRGAAVGGGMGLALMADQVIVGRSAKFSAGFFRLGVVPDCLTLFFLPRLVGLARARNFLFANASWDADDLVANGIALKAVPDDEVDAHGIALAEDLANGPAEVMGLAKQLLLKSFENSLREMMDQEGFAQVLAMAGPEFREGLTALTEKRKPDFQAAAEDGFTNDGLPSSR